MSFLAKLNPFAPIIEKVGDIIDQVVTDKDEANAIKERINNLDFKKEMAELEAGLKVIMTELSGIWIQRAWRPIIMLMFGWLIFWNYFLAPLLSIPVEALPVQLWELLKIGMGGYIVGRSVEKGIKLYKEK